MGNIGIQMELSTRDLSRLGGALFFGDRLAVVEGWQVVIQNTYVCLLPHQAADPELGEILAARLLNIEHLSANRIHIYSAPDQDERKAANALAVTICNQWSALFQCKLPEVIQVDGFRQPQGDGEELKAFRAGVRAALLEAETGSEQIFIVVVSPQVVDILKGLSLVEAVDNRLTKTGHEEAKATDALTDAVIFGSQARSLKF